MTFDTSDIPGWPREVEASLYTHHASNIVSLALIRVPKALRGRGLATEAMKALTSWADENSFTLALTPDASFGSSAARLKKFYGRFGFKMNKGRRRDFTTREAMVRPPAKRLGGLVRSSNGLAIAAGMFLGGALLATRTR